MRATTLAAIALNVLSWTPAVAYTAIKCSADNKCPQDKPCCSQYGECGTGLYCLGACDIRSSFNSSSCVPLPVCESKTYEFNNADDILDQSKYLGDASKYDWTTNGKVVSYNGDVLLAMPKNSYGTVISSTKAVWYGKVSAELMTSHGNGVVSAFILMSQARDEIDYEFVGNNVNEAQSNYYWQGMLDYTKGAKTPLEATNETFHTYEFDWSPEKIDWIIDGNVVRTLNKADTYNETSKSYSFPQTPSIIQLSLWPGGSDQNPQGTVEWAGGSINWNMPEFTKPGYLFATLKQIKVECYDPPSGVEKSGDKSYVFKGDSLLESDVTITDDDYVLKSPLAVGFDMSKGSDDDLQVVSQHVPSNIGGNDGKKTSYEAVSKVDATSSSESFIKVTGSMSKTSKTTKPTSAAASDSNNDKSSSLHGSSSASSSKGSAGAAVAAVTSGSGTGSQAVASDSESSAAGSISEHALAAIVLCGMAGLAVLF